MGILGRGHRSALLRHLTTSIKPWKATRAPELVRQFIDDCLYNPEMGYFNRIVNIFDSGQVPIDFNSLKDQDAYAWHLHRMYRQQSREDEEYYQLWHTPSELFKPWYGQAVAKYMLKFLGKGEPLIVYEIGPGNGSLAKSILDHVQESCPKLYEGMEYHLVDISPILSRIQQSKLHSHLDRVRFHRGSILSMNIEEPRPAFVMAMEVLDNMPHDRIAYDPADGSLLQAMVHTNDDATSFTSSPGRYVETFEEACDPLIIEYMQVMDEIGRKSPSLNWHPLSLLDPIMASRNPWSSEFVPTIAYAFLKHIAKCIPRHRLIISDFSSLPNAVKGHNGPVVQTRYRGDTVACTTYLLQRGLFDIFFPINFSLLSAVHQHVRKGSTGSVLSHAEFCKKFGNVQATRTRSGYNPMLEEFQNVHMYLST